MAKPRFLSLDGVRILVSYFKDQLSGKVDKVDGKSLSDNNFSDEEKAKLAGIEADSQVNVIESISVNGTDQTITNKNVNIDVPLVDDTLQNEGQAADAKATGDAIDELSQSISSTAAEIRGEIADEVADIEQSISAVQEFIPTNVSDLTNDSNFTTQTYVDTELAKKQDTINFATPTSSDVGKALMPKTIENGEVTEWKFGEAGMVDDVQINGTSIVENKVANIPIAGTNYGLVTINSLYGIDIRQNGILQIAPATSDAIKNSMNIKTPITPFKQDESVFYGLAKAAGHDEKDSTLSFGTYTNEAKTAIQSMLGVDAAISDAISNFAANRYYVCENGEYDSETYVPTLEGELGIIYLVPKPVGNYTIGSAQVGTATIAPTTNIFYEFIYTGEKFEQIGDTKVDLTGYLTDGDIATNSSIITMLNEVFS